MIDEVADKLANLLVEHKYLDKEYLVCYFMVQTRKLLEHRKEYGILRSYCDWVVHIDKKQQHQNWKEVFEILNEGVTMLQSGKYRFSIPKAFGYFYGLPLQYELLRFFRTDMYATRLIKDPTWWRTFRVQLFNILKDQPIIDPIPEIKEFKYLSVGQFLHCTVTFTDERGKIENIELPFGG